MTLIAIVGARRGVGKTKLAVRFVKWLSDAGFAVQFIKHSDHEYTLARKDNERALLAGAFRATTMFTNVVHVLEEKRRLQDYVREWDGVTVVEGFRREGVPKIVVAKSGSDLLVPGLKSNVVAVVAPSELREEARKVYPAAHFFPLESVEEVRPWLIEWLGRSLLAAAAKKGCRACGFKSCNELLRAVVVGHEKISRCVGLSGSVTLRVNSERVFLTRFPADVIKAVCTALVSQLRLREEEIKSIEIKIRAEEGGGE